MYPTYFLKTCQGFSSTIQSFSFEKAIKMRIEDCFYPEMSAFLYTVYF
jgi:hypothetical protein